MHHQGLVSGDYIVEIGLIHHYDSPLKGSVCLLGELYAWIEFRIVILKFKS
jgi:hypothetical protein